ncbi:MAG: T9SS type A sorting domain-containing protein [Cryomorphaceae bacterium]
MRRFLLLLALVASYTQLSAQYDTEHWIPPFFAKLEDASGTSNIRNHFVTLTTEVDDVFPVVIENGFGQLIDTVFISREVPIEYTFGPQGNATGNPETSVYPLNVIPRDSLNFPIRSQGLHLYANQPFNAVIRHLSGSQGMALSAKGRSALGKRFYSGHLYTQYNNDPVWNNDRRSHFISVMATEDDTEVTFDMIKPPIYYIGQFGEGVPITVTLDAMESYVIGIDHDSFDNLTINNSNGTRIQSDKPIVCNSGSWLSGMANGQDIGADQLLPVEYIGTEYIASLGLGNEVTERVMIVATEDDTDVFLNGNDDSPVSNLDEGEFYVVEFMDYDENGNVYISSDKKIYVYQTTSFSATKFETTLGFISLPDLSCSGSKNVLTFSPSFSFGENQIRVLAKTGALVFHNEEFISDAVEITGNEEWVEYTIPNIFSVNRLESDSILIVFESIEDNVVGKLIGWSGYNKVSSVGVVSTTSDLNPCFPSNAFFEASGFDSYNWFFNGELMEGTTSDSLTPYFFGDYSVQGIGSGCDSLPLLELDLPLCSSELGIVLELQQVTQTEDLVFDLAFRIFVENFGEESIDNIQVLFDIEAGLPDGAQIEVIQDPQISFGILSGGVNSAYDGTAETTMLPGSGGLPALAADAIDLTLRMNMNESTADGFYAQATVNNTSVGPNDGITGPFENQDYSGDSFNLTEDEDNPNVPSKNQPVLVCFFSNAVQYAQDSISILDDNLYSAQVEGVSQGQFTATPEGLSIDANTGEIDPSESEAGNYVITFATEGRCPTMTSAEITITPSTVGLSEEALRSGVSVFPNPSKGRTSVKIDSQLLDQHLDCLVIISDATGKKIHQQKAKPGTSELPFIDTAGMYFYRIETSAGMALNRGKFVIAE